MNLNSQKKNLSYSIQYHFIQLYCRRSIKYFGKYLTFNRIISTWDIEKENIKWIMNFGPSFLWKMENQTFRPSMITSELLTAFQLSLKRSFNVIRFYWTKQNVYTNEKKNTLQGHEFMEMSIRAILHFHLKIHKQLKYGQKKWKV